MARENADQDTLVVGEFKGMATSGGIYGANLSYLDSLTNASVEKDGRLRRRVGSRYINGLAMDNSLTSQVFQFNYKGNDWFIQRTGTTLQLYKIALQNGQIFSIQVHSSKVSVLKSATEEATFAVKAEGDYCHVYIATRSTQLISMTLVYREFLATSVSATQVVGTIGGFYTTADRFNTQILRTNGFLQEATTVSVATTGVGTFTFSTTPPEITVGSKVAMVSCFLLRYCDANYYAGGMLSNRSLRLNTIALDVNVEVSDPISANYIYNEPIQDLNVESLYAFKDTTPNASRYTWSNDKQPNTTSEWDFSNGSYKVETGKLTIRTPSFIAFGGLLSTNISEQVNLIRLRYLLVGAFERPRAEFLRVYADKVLRPTVLHNSNSSPITDYVNDRPTYFSMTATSTQAPGVSLDAVVEIVFNINQIGSGASFTPADISRDLASIVIGDGFVVPLYGYNLLAKQGSGVFPNKVAIVGNRMLLFGDSNLILASSSDWNFRGFTTTNMQVSSFNFSENSPFLIQVEQNGGNVVAIRSVNGVLIVATEANTYRITANDRNSPPSASSALVSRLTNEIASENNILVVNNSVYMANSNGLFSLEYKSEQDEGVVEDISLPVSSEFRKYTPEAIAYSRVSDSIHVSFINTNKMLTYSLRSETWSYTHISIPHKPVLFPTLDGYTFFIPGSPNKYLMVCVWNKNETNDVVNANFASTLMGANNATITSTPSNFTTILVTPPELLNTLNSNVKPVYNKQNIASTTTVIEETAAGNPNLGKPVICSFVTKAFHNNKLGSSLRFRNFSLVVANVGTAKVSVIPSASTVSTNLSTFNISIDNFGRATVNNRKTTDTPLASETTVVLSDLGISDCFTLGVTFDTLEVIGFQLDSSIKANRKLVN